MNVQIITKIRVIFKSTFAVSAKLRCFVSTRTITMTINQSVKLASFCFFPNDKTYKNICLLA